MSAADQISQFINSLGFKCKSIFGSDCNYFVLIECPCGEKNIERIVLDSEHPPQVDYFLEQIRPQFIEHLRVEGFPI